MRSIVFALLLMSVSTFAGEVFKCKDAKGSITFTNIKCPDNSSAQHYGSYTPAPDQQPANDAPLPQGATPPSTSAPPLPARPPIVGEPSQTENSNLVRCTRPDGRVYVQRISCSSSPVVVGQEPDNRVRDIAGVEMPGAHYTSDHTAIDAHGNFLTDGEIRPRESVDDVVMVPDQAQGVGKEAAAVRSRGGSFGAMRKADDKVWDICKRPADSTRKP
jgi:hypothetical protein